MASVREIKRRIRSVKNIRQITMALEAVAASRVRRAVAQALSARAYANAAMQVLVDVGSANKSPVPLHPLLASRPNVGTITVALITSDRGLSGSYNSNVIRIARQFAQHMGKSVRWVAIGRKGRDMLYRMKEQVVAEFTGLPAWLTVADIRPIEEVLTEEFLKSYSDEVYVAFTNFINTLTQKPQVQRILPLGSAESQLVRELPYIKKFDQPEVRIPEYIYEPSAAAILDEIVPKFVQNVIYELMLESTASEQSARMVAMRNASENAKALADDLQLEYNKARQASITSEILDIVGGVEALRKARKGAEAPEESVIIEDTAYQGL